MVENKFPPYYPDVLRLVHSENRNTNPTSMVRTSKIFADEIRTGIFSQL